MLVFKLNKKIINTVFESVKN